MDVIKVEAEVDPLAIEASDNTDFEEKKPLFEEVNLLPLRSAQIKLESEDHSCVHTSEIQFQEIPEPVGKCKAEEGTLSDLQMTRIKTECDDLTSEIEVEGSPVVKSETEVLMA
ncbi:uncharacterized protein [Periplaneta americana]|uniref:uncharacterized protein isoform X3 n=1 Tax=Periplaneta americana TaxID=6978 RepID=UPI0037E94CDB